MLLSLLLVAALPAPGFRIAKTDFPKFAGSIDCKWEGEACPGAAQGFVVSGRTGEEIPDPTAAELTAGGKVVVGFLEGKPFSFARYAVDFPTPRSKWVVLNELSSGDQNNVFLTQWKTAGDSLEFVSAYPRSFPLDLGETFVFAKAALPDKSLLVILKGEGSDAGVNLQDFRLLRLQAPTKAVQAPGMAGKTAGSAITEVARRTNRSEIPVQKILERINADETVDPVIDSSLACEIAKGKKAPSGGPLLRFIKTRTKVLYTKSGPEETPIGKDTVTLDIWKTVKKGR
jgi:hypothetical protein